MTSLSDNYQSSSEAAKVLGIHPFTIQKLLRDGRLPAEKIANRWLISRQVAEEFSWSSVAKQYLEVYEEIKVRSRYHSVQKSLV